MPTPPECQPIADAIAGLSAQEQTQREALPGLTGIAKWKAMETLGSLRQQIADQQTLLDECLKSHAGELTTQIVVIDLPGNSGPNRIARVWQLASSGQAVKQTVTVQNNQATFQGIDGIARQTFGITIEETDHPTVNGPDFRSGPLPVVGVNSPDPFRQIEIVILDPIVLTGDSLRQAAPALPIPMSFPAGPVGTISLSVNDLQVVVSNGEVSLSASGTAATAGSSMWTLLPGQTSPFTFALRLHFVPTFSMTPNVMLEVLPETIPVISVPGLVGSVLQSVGAMLATRLIDLAAKPLATLFNQVILKRVTSSLGLSDLPSGAVLSVRQLTAENDHITVVPVLAAFGTVLSDFQPSALIVTARLATLDVQPTSIGTSNPANRAAQGSVNLDRPAGAGGVTVQLSTDRPDIIVITPTSLVIPEGVATGTFTAAGSGQSIMGTAQVDGTIRASLGTQTLTAPLSVRPEAPVTAVLASAVSVAPPAIPSGGVVSITLDTPSPLPRGQNIRGKVVLDETPGFGEHSALVSFFPAVQPATQIHMHGDVQGYFNFTLAPGFTGTALRITAQSVSSGLSKSIDVDVA